MAVAPPTSAPSSGAGMTKEERMVVFASSLGTVFEWSDFYLYGSLAAFIAKHFFVAVNEATSFIFALLAFAAGFAVRPFGAIVFGRLGDLIGRKYTFLVTIMIMGMATFIVGLLPGYNSIGAAAPIILIGLRLLQGLALGGEYGGAATYVCEHAPKGKRGFFTSWIQTTATVGLFISLLVILGCRILLGPKFDDWGWRIPFLISILLLAISVYIRMQLQESPVFQRMKAEGKGSKAPLTESFLRWGNLKIVLLALFGQDALSKLYETRGEPHLARHDQSILACLETVAREGVLSAKYTVPRIYAKGLGVTPDKPKAKALLKHLSNQEAAALLREWSLH